MSFSALPLWFRPRNCSNAGSSRSRGTKHLPAVEGAVLFSSSDEGFRASAVEPLEGSKEYRRRPTIGGVFGAGFGAGFVGAGFGAGQATPTPRQVFGDSRLILRRSASSTHIYIYACVDRKVCWRITCLLFVSRQKLLLPRYDTKT